MKLEQIIKKFLPASISPKSIESLSSSIENIGKSIAGLLAVLYIAGLIIFGLYQSALHIRSIELLQLRYVFVGFYYFTFLFLHLAYPVWWIKRIWIKIVYLFFLLFIIIYINPINNVYFNYLLMKWSSGASYFEFKPDNITILNNNLILLAGQFLFASGAIFVFKKVVKIDGLKKLHHIFIVFPLFAFFFNYQIFMNNIFYFIPDAIGGGKAPIVHILFNENLPYEVTSNFDLYSHVSGYTKNYHYGQLVYIDDNSVFLKEPFWYTEDVYEINRKDIIMFEYTDYNPAEMGQPGLFP